LSTFAGNELLIDIANLMDMDLLGGDEVTELTALPSRYVDCAALIPIKNRLLRLAASRFANRAEPRLTAACDRFVAEHDDAWLHDYALYRILKYRHEEQPWLQWQPRYRQRDAAALRELEIAADPDITELKVLQFLFHDQWRRLREYANGRGIRLFGDLPIYIALDSADAWSHPEILRLDRHGHADAVAGVPPDYFSADGQLWGNPLYAWDFHAANGFKWWAERLRAATRLADIVRIDHFRGFESYWSVPAGAKTARSGAWEAGPGDAIFDALRSALGNLPVVAEDLGVITRAVDALRRRHNFPGMNVLQFGVADEDFDLAAVEENSVCYTGTHDNDTTTGWFNGSPDDTRSDAEIEETQRAALQITGGTPASIHDDLIRAAFSTDARLAIAPLQDYLGLGSDARFNTPGTAGGNWRWRVTDGQLSDDACAHIAGLVRDSRRQLQN
jgi:4-alpha-glucanotransferase